MACVVSGFLGQFLKETRSKSRKTVTVSSWHKMIRYLENINIPLFLLHRQESLSPCSEEATVFPDTVQSILDPNRRSVDESSEDKPSSPENNDSMFKRGPLAHGGSIGQKAKDVLSRQGSNASERINGMLSNC